MAHRFYNDFTAYNFFVILLQFHEIYVYVIHWLIDKHSVNLCCKILPPIHADNRKDIFRSWNTGNRDFHYVDSDILYHNLSHETRLDTLQKNTQLRVKLLLIESNN